MLKLENVCAGYGKLDVLWNVSCEVDDGEFVAIVGPNGAGKTTTMRAISGMIRPKSGSIIFNDVHLENKRISICGDLAADPEMTEFFLQIGIDELSVAPGEVLSLRKRIREIQ